MPATSPIAFWQQRATDRLPASLRGGLTLYSEGIRRISLMEQHVLYDIDDQARKVRILAVVGQRQNPHIVR